MTEPPPPNTDDIEALLAEVKFQSNRLADYSAVHFERGQYYGAGLALDSAWRGLTLALQYLTDEP